MKSLIALAAFAASRVCAQTSYSTETYTSCESDTVTGTTTVTTPCSHSSCTATPTDAARAGHITTWVTSYTALCSDASADNYQKVYTTTVTESCSEATPTWAHTNANYVPPAWTTGPMVCTECGSAPVTMAMATYPMAVAPSGTVVPEKMQTPMAPAPAAASGTPAMPGAASAAMPAAASPAPEMPLAPVGSAPAMPESPVGSPPEISAAEAPAAAPSEAVQESAPAAAGPASPVVTAVENYATGSTPLTPAGSSPSPMYQGTAGTLSKPIAGAVALVGAVAAAFCML